MSMNLKPAIRYQLREYLVSCLVFWAINALLIGIGFLVLSLNLGERGPLRLHIQRIWFCLCHLLLGLWTDPSPPGHSPVRTDGGLSPDNLSQSFSLRFAARCLPLSGGRTAAVPGPVCR